MGLISFGKGKSKVVAYTTKSGPKISMPKARKASQEALAPPRAVRGASAALAAV